VVLPGQIAVGRSLGHAESCGNLGDVKTLLQQFGGPTRFCLSRAAHPAGIHAALLRRSDPRSLTFATKLHLHLSDPEKDGGQHLAERAVDVDLLRRGDDSQTLFAPVGKRVDPVPQTAQQCRDHDPTEHQPWV